MKKLLVFIVSVNFFISSSLLFSTESSAFDESDDVAEFDAIKNSLKQSQTTATESAFKTQFNKLKNLAQTDSVSKIFNSGKEYAWHKIKQDMEDQNPNRHAKAMVTEGSRLSNNEARYRAARKPKVYAALEKIFPTTAASQIDDVSIGFVGTGGGYRAMILTAGYLSALQDIGLYDSLMYAATLSGSTWTLAPMISLGLSPKEYKSELLKKVQNKQFNLLKLEKSLLSNVENIKALVNNNIWPKFVYGQPIRTIDMYGFMLSRVLFGADGYNYHLSDQWEKIRVGNVPFPIYTAVSMSKKSDATYSYDLYEFNPIDIRTTLANQDGTPSTFVIPSYSFASEFAQGKSLEIPPEQTLGYLMGIFGSAYSINFKDIDRLVFESINRLDAGKLSLDRIKYYISSAILKILTSLDVGSARFSPAQIFNPFKNYPSVPDYLKDKDFLTLIDAGIVHNIPALPLLVPERRLKFLIICESSSNAEAALELKKFFANASEMYGYTYKRVDALNNKTIRFYKDLDNKNAPRIIYINFLKDENLMKLSGISPLSAQEKLEKEELKKFIVTNKLDSFDPRKCLADSFCGTFNFEYSPEQFLQLSGMAEFNIKANKEVILDFLLEDEQEVDIPVFGNP